MSGPRCGRPRPILPVEEIVGRAYLRFSALDRPGTLAHITGILGSHEIGIESVSQTGQGGDGESVPVLMQTDPVKESVLREALDEIEPLPTIRLGEDRSLCRTNPLAQTRRGETGRRYLPCGLEWARRH